MQRNRFSHARCHASRTFISLPQPVPPSRFSSTTCATAPHCAPLRRSPLPAKEQSPVESANCHCCRGDEYASKLEGSWTPRGAYIRRSTSDESHFTMHFTCTPTTPAPHFGIWSGPAVPAS